MIGLLQKVTYYAVINLILCLIFLKNKNPDNNKLNFFEVIKKESNVIIIILLLNLIMLFLGFLGETSRIPIMTGILLGFIPFLIYYYIIYDKYAFYTNDGLKIFFYFLFIWSFYGIVAFLPYNIKNISYNILDLFSKNFFGLYLTYLIFTNKN
jgi:hypothetical protein